MKETRGYSGATSLEDLNHQIHNDEGSFGSLIKLDNYMDSTIATFDGGYAPEKSLKLRTTAGSMPVPPAGASRFICKGEVWITSSLLEVAAFRID